ncbi:hypothetical protein HYS95_03175 [Candidatus Daviesbacteria bacterium]|nr:hypothetical protein [Candidatus Daviesbacteria bacterium]
MAVALEEKTRVKVATRLTLPKTFLAQAIVAKNTPLYANEARFKGFSYEDDIFPQARYAFKQYHTLYDTNEKFAEYFTKDFNRRNPQLLEQIAPETTAEEGYTVTEQTGQPATEPSATNRAGGGGLPFNMPGGSAPGFSFPRTIHNVPHAEKPDITIANSSGHVTEAGDPSKLVKTTSTGQIQEAGNPSKLVTANSSGVVREPGDFSKLVNTRGEAIKSSSIGGARNIKVPSEFSNLGSNIGSKLGIGANKGLNKIISGINNFGLGGGGAGSGSIFNRLGRFGRGGGGFFGKARATGGRAGSFIGKAKSKWKLALLGLLVPMMLVGMMTIPSSSSTTPATGTPTLSSDISKCEFTRGQENPSAAKFQSSTLLSYIQEASLKSSIPPAVFAAFIRVESPSSSGMSDSQIANYANNCAESPTGALGIMQIQPPGTTSARGDPASCDDCIDAGAKLVGKTVSTLTRADYCDPRTNIIIGAGWILKKMSNIGYGDGTKWDPSWTNDPKAITALVNTYYGDVLYPDVNTGPHNYATDVQTSIQNCQATASSGPLPPPADGNYQTAMAGFGIEMKNGFANDEYKWAFEILNKAVGMFPKFQEKIHTACSNITLEPTAGISHADNCDIPLSTGTGETFFKYLVIHELAHKINTTGWIYNSSIIATRAADAAQDTKNNNGFLTYYSEHAARATDKICGSGDNDGNRADEEFADSVAYYVNNQTSEQNMHVANDAKGMCGVKWGDNPFAGGTRFTKHYEYITIVLQQ